MNIVTFSHLRWNFVFQRPQHLLSRLSKRWPVYFIEEPILIPNAKPHLKVAEPSSGIHVLTPYTTHEVPGFSDQQIPTIRNLLDDFFRTELLGRHMVWFYTPMAVPLLDAFRPEAIIYDCMDELSAFRFAPAQLKERESELFQRATLVFTGGRSLFEAKQTLHSNVHCFPSSVDISHFSGAEHRPEAADQLAIPHPRFGYFGVIDERIDLDLLHVMAQKHPEWQIVLVGPVAKIDPATLPDAGNIHYLGQRTYDQLPSYINGWDVCLLPFARNEATRFISPTKTLEYMAAGKPIVSTPIKDVVSSYGEVVYFGESKRSWVGACEEALKAGTAERKRRRDSCKNILRNTSWDRTVVGMANLLERTVRLSTRPEADTIVIGAGPTGLSAAYHLGSRATLIEANDRVGGWCRSIEDRGFTFDFAGHIMFSNDPHVHHLYGLLLGSNVHWQDREAWVYSKDVYTRYPFQGSLFGLPPDVIKECLVGAIEARFGKLNSIASQNAPNNGCANNCVNGHTVKHTNGYTTQSLLANDKGDCQADCCGDGILESSTLTAGRSSVTRAAHTEPQHFEEFIYKVWGKGIAKHFAIPYNRKLWAVPLDEMETSWLGGRVPLPDLEEIIEGALGPSPKPMGPNARFGYPLHGGFQALMDGFLPLLKGELLLKRRVVSIDAERHLVCLSDNSWRPYQSLISTIPLPLLISMLSPLVPTEISEAASKLRHVSVRCVNLGIGRTNLTEKHWIYYPEETVFHRIFVQGNASPHCNAPGGFGITCEITYSPHKPLPCEGDALIQRCIEDCHSVGIFRPNDPIWSKTQCDLPYAYVVYDHARKNAVETIRSWLEMRNIYLAGRYSEWEYYNSDHAFLAGKKAAEKVASSINGQSAYHRLDRTKANPDRSVMEDVL